MNVYVIDNGVVRGLTINYNHYPVSIIKDWRKCKPERSVVTINNGLWYQLSDSGLWNTLTSKPDVINMAELIGAIQPITIAEVKSEISSDSFFDKR